MKHLEGTLGWLSESQQAAFLFVDGGFYVYAPLTALEDGGTPFKVGEHVEFDVEQTKNGASQAAHVVRKRGRPDDTSMLHLEKVKSAEELQTGLRTDGRYDVCEPARPSVRRV